MPYQCEVVGDRTGECAVTLTLSKCDPRSCQQHGQSDGYYPLEPIH